MNTERMLGEYSLDLFFSFCRLEEFFMSDCFFFFFLF